jgi:hypothetical protein
MRTTRELSRDLRQLAVRNIGSHQQLLAGVALAVEAADWIGLGVEAHLADLMAVAEGLIEAYADDPPPTDQLATQEVPS